MKNIFLENTFYKNTKEKENLEKDKIRIKNIFWLNFIGFVALRKTFPKNQKILSYLKNDQKLQIQNITDENSDFSLSVKIFHDAGFLSDSVVRKITKFMVLLKQGKEVDEQLFRDNILKKLYQGPISKIKASKRIMTHVNDFFIAKKTLSEILPDLLAAGIVFKRVSYDFVRIAKPLVISNQIKSNDINNQQQQVIDQQKKNIAIKTKTPITSLLSTSKTKLDQYIDNINIDTFLNSSNDLNMILLKILTSDLKSIKLTLKYFGLKSSDIKTTLITNINSTILKKHVDQYITGQFINDNFYDVFVPNFYDKFSKKQKSIFLNNIQFIFDDVYSKKYVEFLEKTQKDMDSLRVLFIDNNIKNFDINKYFKNITDNKDETIKDFFPYRAIFLKFISKITRVTFEKLYYSFDLNFNSYIKNYVKFDENENIRKYLIDMGVIHEFQNLKLSTDEKKSYQSFDTIKKIFEDEFHRINSSLKRVFDIDDIFKIIQSNNFLKEFENEIQKNIEFRNTLIRKEFNSDMLINDDPVNDFEYYDLLLKYDTDQEFFRYLGQFVTERFYKSINSIINNYKNQFEKYIIDFPYFTDKFYKFFMMSQFIEVMKYSLFTYSFIIEKIIFKNPEKNDLNIFRYFIIEIKKSTLDKFDIKKFDDVLKFIISKIDFNVRQYYSTGFEIALNFFIQKHGFFPKWFETKLMEIKISSDNDIIYRIIDKILSNLNFKPSSLYINYLKEFINDEDFNIKKIDNTVFDKNINQNVIDIYDLSKEKNKIGVTKQVDELIEIYDDGFNEIIFQRNLNLYPELKEKYLNGINDLLNQDKFKLKKFNRVIDQKDIELINFSFNSQFIKNFIDNDKFIDIISKNIDSVKQVREYTQFNIFFNDVYEKNKKMFNQVIGNLESDVKNVILNDIKNKLLLQNVYKGVLDDSNSLIQPNFKNAENLKGALKFNNFNVVSKIRIKNDETPIDFLERVKSSKILDIPKQDIEVIEMTEEEKDLKTIEWYENHYSGKHGETFMKCLDSFSVNWNLEKYNEFLISQPNSEIIKPVFHGTGSIAASMILRFGFNVQSVSKTENSGIAAAGRMLGEGIYFAPNIDKVAGYCSDGNWSHRSNEEGYIFEMSVILGDKPANYRSAGTGNDNIRSPEYCVFRPDHQINVLKVYRVKKVNIKYVKELKNSKKG